MIIKVHLQPGAKRNEIVGRHGDAIKIKIKIKAPPVDGKANEALIEFLSETLGIAKSKIEIVSGHTSRQKLVSIACNEALIDQLIK
jgi:uncharacterized protein (TIGR00251 family)